MSLKEIAEIKRELRSIYKDLQGEGRGLDSVKLRITILSELIRILELEAGKEPISHEQKT